MAAWGAPRGWLNILTTPDLRVPIFASRLPIATCGTRPIARSGGPRRYANSSIRPPHLPASCRCARVFPSVWTPATSPAHPLAEAPSDPPGPPSPATIGPPSPGGRAVVPAPGRPAARWTIVSTAPLSFSDSDGHARITACKSSGRSPHRAPRAPAGAPSFSELPVSPEDSGGCSCPPGPTLHPSLLASPQLSAQRGGVRQIRVFRRKPSQLGLSPSVGGDELRDGIAVASLEDFVDAILRQVDVLPAAVIGKVTCERFQVFGERLSFGLSMAIDSGRRPASLHNRKAVYLDRACRLH